MNSKEVEGAKLTLTGKDKDGNVIIFKDGQIEAGDGAKVINGVGNALVWESGKTKTVVNVADGIYTLEEVAAPKGYEVANAITFEVVNGKVVKGGKSADTVEMIDERIVTTTTE